MVIADMDKCTKSPTGEHVWNFTPRPDNCRLGTCRYCEQQRVFEGGMTHTAALIKTAPVKPETLEKAVVIAERSLSPKVTEPAPACRKRSYCSRGYKLSVEQKTDIKRRIKAGDKVSLIAKDFKVSIEEIYIFRRELGIHGHNRKKPGHAAAPVPAQVQPAAPEVKRNGHNRIAVVYDNQHRGNLALQLLRLKRGELRPQTTKTVIRRYKAMLEYDLGRAQKQVRDTKHSLAAVNDALHELEVIENGQKDIIEKVLAVVR